MKKSILLKGPKKSETLRSNATKMDLFRVGMFIGDRVFLLFVIVAIKASKQFIHRP
jgi:hypothetical protein